MCSSSSSDPLDLYLKKTCIEYQLENFGKMNRTSSQKILSIYSLWLTIVNKQIRINRVSCNKSVTNSVTNPATLDIATPLFVMNKYSKNSVLDPKPENSTYSTFVP